MTDPLEYYRPPEPRRPAALTAVAWIFICFGILAVLEVVVGLFQSRLSINLAILGIFIGRGLLNLRRGWRTCALVFIWIGLIAMPLLVIIALASGNAHVNLFGAKSDIPAVFVCVPVAGLFALDLWQYRVLTRPDIRSLFQ